MYLVAGCAEHCSDNAPLELTRKSHVTLLIGDGVAHNDIFLLLQVFDEHAAVEANEHIGNPGGVQGRSAPKVCSQEQGLEWG